MTPFTPSHRGGSGAPLVCLHGFMETWRSWELVLPALERRHDALALTLPGHAGAPRVSGRLGRARRLGSRAARLPDGAAGAGACLGGLRGRDRGNPEGRRRATELLTTNCAHIPADLVAHLIVGVPNCDAAPALVDYGLTADWTLDAERITCPVRIVWGSGDRLLPWPSAATRYLRDWLPNADWIVLDGVGHAPQLDVPLEAAELIAGFTSG